MIKEKLNPPPPTKKKKKKKLDSDGSGTHFSLTHLERKQKKIYSTADQQNKTEVPAAATVAAERWNTGNEGIQPAEKKWGGLG